MRPILPPQQQPVLDGGLMHRAWYLPFQDLAESAATAGGMVQFGLRSDRISFDTGNLENGSIWFEEDTGLIYQWRVLSSSMAWVCILGTQTFQMTLTTAATTINAPSTGALELIYFIDQDGTGGRSITWGTGFGYTSNSLGTAAANTRSTFRFVLDSFSGLYTLAAQPLVDMSK